MGDVISLSGRRAVDAAADGRGAVTGTTSQQSSVTSTADARRPPGRRSDGTFSRRDESTPRQSAKATRHPAAGATSARIDGARDASFDAELVVGRLEAAGRTLLALPGTGYSTGMRVSRLEIVQSALEAFGAECGPVRAAVPSAAAISQMDEALGWISLIPVETMARGRPGGGNVLRRIVGARALVGPVTERHIYSWRRLGSVLGADHKAVQRWHAQAIDIIVDALSRLATNTR